MKSYLKSDIRPHAALYMIGFCSAYITQVTPFSPFYFAYFIALLIGGIVFMRRFSIPIFPHKNDYTLVITLLLFVFYVIADTLWKQNQKITAYVVTLLFNQFSLVFTCYCLRIGKNRVHIPSVLHVYVYIAVAIGICDFLYRFFHASLSFTGKLFFYNYKQQSLMFLDSNWTGFIYMIAFSFFLYVRERYGWAKRRWLFLLFLIVVLSFSRAAIVSCLVVLFFNFVCKQPKSIRNCVAFIVCMGIFAVPFIIHFLLRDDSFGTKMALLKGLNYYVRRASLSQLLVGNGMGTSSTALDLLGNVGYGGHLYLVIKIIDTGLIGLFLEMLFFANVGKLTHGYFIYLFLPFFLCGLSMCPGNLSFLYVFGGLMIYLENYVKPRSKIWN